MIKLVKISATILFLVISNFNLKCQIKLDDYEIKREIIEKKLMGKVIDENEIKQKNSVIFNKNVSPLKVFAYNNFLINSFQTSIINVGVLGIGGTTCSIKNDRECSSLIRNYKEMLEDGKVSFNIFAMGDCMVLNQSKCIEVTPCSFELNKANYAIKDVYGKTYDQYGHQIMGYRLPVSGSSKIDAGQLFGTSIYPIINGKQRNRHSIVGPFVFSNDGKHLSYFAYGDGNNYTNEDVIYMRDTIKALIYRDYKPLKQHDFIRPSSLIYSPDSKHISYAAFDSNKWSIVIDSTVQQEYDNIKLLTYSPNSEKLACAVLQNNKWSVLINNNIESGSYDDIQYLIFSPDSKKIFIVAKDKNEIIVIYDGTEYHRNRGYKIFYTDLIRFSQNGERFGYFTSIGMKDFLILDGKEISDYKGTPLAATFNEDASHFYSFGRPVGTNGCIFKDGILKSKVSMVSFKDFNEAAYSYSDFVINTNGTIVAWVDKISDIYYLKVNGNKNPSSYGLIRNIRFESPSIISFIANEGALIYQMKERITSETLPEFNEELNSKTKEDKKDNQSNPYLTELIDSINLNIKKADYIKTLELINIAKSIDSTRIDLVFTEGTLYEKLKKPTLAVDSYKKCISINSEYSNAYWNLGVFYYNNAVVLYNAASKSKNNEEIERLNSSAANELKSAYYYLSRFSEIEPLNEDVNAPLSQIRKRLKL
jgi:tetratricopeptide (TPR) repeat protein